MTKCNETEWPRSFNIKIIFVEPDIHRAAIPSANALGVYFLPLEEMEIISCAIDNNLRASFCSTTVLVET